MLSIIPTPKVIEEKEGFFSIEDASLILALGSDRRVELSLGALALEIGAINPESALPSGGGSVCISHGEKGEGYTLSVSVEGITIKGEGPEGAFYGIQSLIQLIRLNGTSVPCCYIEDFPDFSYRGFYLDITRGRVPTLEKLYSIADTLSFYKINSLQLYVESAFTFKELSGIATPDCALTPEEVRAFSEYCKDRFIDLVPSLSTFGHLYALLQSDGYRHISELPEHSPQRAYWLERQWHHTLNPYHPESFEVIRSMIEQYLPLFSSDYFNICCDETMDLCNGVNKGKDKGEAYFYHVDKLVSLISRYGKTVMLWGDECMAHTELAREHLPDSAVILNWCYRKRVNEWIPRVFYEGGFKQIACTGTSSWDNFIENIDISTGNISSFAEHAKKYSCLGILNTCWGDFGHICSFSCNLYGLLFGAQKSWNVKAPADRELEISASRLLYGVKEFNMADTLRALAKASSTCSWSDFVIYHSRCTLEGKRSRLGYGGGELRKFTKRDAVKALKLCEEELLRLRSVEGCDPVITDIILSAEAISLMNRLVLYINRAKDYDNKEALQKDFDEWLTRYSEAWLRDNKPSELWRIEELIGAITDTPQSKSR